MEPVLCSINEAARTLGIGKTKTYELINGGQLECVTLGTRRLVKIASIRNLVENATEKAGQSSTGLNGVDGMVAATYRRSRAERA
jgi:excisionase family DNA binding protein